MILFSFFLFFWGGGGVPFLVIVKAFFSCMDTDYMIKFKVQPTLTLDFPFKLGTFEHPKVTI